MDTPQAKPELPAHRMTVDEYLAWAEDNPGRYELDGGWVVAMSPERTRHAEVKFAAQTALRDAIRQAGVPCRMLPDGMTVRVDDHTAFEPDALVYCGERLPPDAVEVPAPVVVVEVLSPSTRGVDTGLKAVGYLRVPSIQHYLLVEPGQHMVVYHRRTGPGTFETTLVPRGPLRLDPPGLELDVASFFAS